MNNIPVVLRLGVAAALIMNGKALLFQRCDHKKSWQFPQGGIEPLEDFKDAVYREIYEETGLKKKDLKLLAEKKDYTIYTFAESSSCKKAIKGKAKICFYGQVHKWFLFEVKSDATLDLSAHGGAYQEFCGFRLVDIDKIDRFMVDFKKPVYREVKEWIKSVLNKKDK